MNTNNRDIVNDFTRMETIMDIEHGDHQCSGYGPGKWFRCGACHRRCCYCYGSDSSLRSFVNLCDECWGHATKQAELEGIDPEGEAA